LIRERSDWPLGL